MVVYPFTPIKIPGFLINVRMFIWRFPKMGGPAPDLGWGPQWLNLWKMDDWGYPYGPGNAHHFAMNRGDPEFFFDDPFFFKPATIRAIHVCISREQAAHNVQVAFSLLRSMGQKFPGCLIRIPAIYKPPLSSGISIARLHESLCISDVVFR